MNVKKKSLKSLRKEAWGLFSIHVRKKYSDMFRGFAYCYTCRVVFNWNELQAGHYIHGKLDFDERNIHPQCTRCNHFLSGNLGVYGERLIEELGIDEVKKMRREAATWRQPNREECLALIEKYK